MVAIEQMTVLFIIMLVGYIAFKKDILTESINKRISGIVLYIANPAMILSSVMGDNSKIKGESLVIMVLVTIIAYALLIGISFIIPRMFMMSKGSLNTYSIMVVFSNISFMGMPIVRSFVGDNGLLYAAIYVIPFNVLIYTYGVAMLRKDVTKDKEGGSLIKSILNIGTIASVIAILIFVIGIPIPYVIKESCGMLGNLTAPLSMMIIGASFATINLKNMVTDIKLLLFCLFKQFIIPIVGIWLIRLFVTNDIIVNVMFVMLATPVASMVAMLTQEYDGDFELATRGVALSTIISVISIPIISALMNI
ncbi:MAG: hypothetical protein E7270_12335 [Lachnospiraceae bacterium]|nr:hypothetical protein [Lachnospiraceae bacterium]